MVQKAQCQGGWGEVSVFTLSLSFSLSIFTFEVNSETGLVKKSWLLNKVLISFYPVDAQGIFT